MTGAALVHDPDVRHHFSHICWIPFGQAPVMQKLQQLLYLQVTSRELHADTSAERKEQLRIATRNKRILVVVDDLWNAEDELELAIADVSAGSKYLISTRVRGLLDDSHTVEIKLPSEREAVHILMATAGASHQHGPGGLAESQSIPMGAIDIARHCARLPLALAIAGRLVNSLGLAQDNNWDGLVDILKEELRNTSSGGIEESCIRATLRSLKGSAAEKEAINSVLLLMAIVPEDTVLPLEVLQVMYDATTNVKQGSRTSIMKIRQWLRVLLDRSLVLGTVDRPSLHDLVLGADPWSWPDLILLSCMYGCNTKLTQIMSISDFVVSQHTEEQLREKHRAVVQAFRKCRPTNAHGIGEWDRDSPGTDFFTRYVRHEVIHHVRGGWQADALRDRLAIDEWLGDTPQDAITVAAAEVAGWKMVMELAEAADEKQDWWTAARYWSLSGIVAWVGVEQHELLPDCTTARAVTLHLWRCAMASLNRLDQSMTPVGPAIRAEKDALEVGLIFKIFGEKDPADVALLTPQAKRILTTEAATVHALDTAMIIGCIECFPAFFAPDMMGICRAMRSFVEVLHTQLDCPDKLYREKCLISMAAWHGCFAAIASTDPDENLDKYFGPGGHRFTEAAEIYFRDPMGWCRFFIEREGDDKMLNPGLVAYCIADRYGDLATAQKCLRSTALLYHQLCQEDDPKTELTQLSMATWYPLTLGTVFGFGSPTAQFFVDTIGLGYDDFEAMWRACHHPNVRPFGDTTMNRYMMSSEMMIWTMKLANILAGKVAVADKISELPSLDDIQCWSQTFSTVALVHVFSFCLYLLKGLVLERAGPAHYAEAHQCVDIVLDPDLRRGSACPTTQANALALRGRIQVAQSREAEAQVAFAAGLAIAQRCGRWLVALQIVGDMKRAGMDWSAASPIYEKLAAPRQELEQVLDGGRGC